MSWSGSTSQGTLCFDFVKSVAQFTRVPSHVIGLFESPVIAEAVKHVQVHAELANHIMHACSQDRLFMTAVVGYRAGDAGGSGGEGDLV